MPNYLIYPPSISKVPNNIINPQVPISKVPNYIIAPQVALSKDPFSTAILYCGGSIVNIVRFRIASVVRLCAVNYHIVCESARWLGLLGQCI